MSDRRRCRRNGRWVTCSRTAHWPGRTRCSEWPARFARRSCPCDALIYLGTGYCPAGWNTGHASVDFNPATFDKPAEMIDALHDQHFHIVLHQNAPPRRLTGDEVTRVDVDDTEAKRANRIGAAATFPQYWARHRKTFALGVDGWWPDDGDELRRESRIARHRLYYQGPLLDRPNVRPWNLQRTGYAGVQRYGGWIWTGDIDSRWETLATQVPIGQNHALSLSPYWGTDIGGFYPTRELTGELYVRWFQFGAFCPSFRAHGRTWHLRLPWGWNTGELGPDEHNRSVDLNELHNAERRADLPQVSRTALSTCCRTRTRFAARHTTRACRLIRALVAALSERRRRP